MGESEFFWKSWKLRPGVLEATKGPLGDQGAKPLEKYEIWGLPDHPEMKIFTLFLGIKVLMSTSNFMIFQGVEYYKTGNASEYPRLLSYNVCICFVFLLLAINIDNKVVFSPKLYFSPWVSIFYRFIAYDAKTTTGNIHLNTPVSLFPSSTVLFIQPRPSPTVC